MSEPSTKNVPVETITALPPGDGYVANPKVPDGAIPEASTKGYADLLKDILEIVYNVLTGVEHDDAGRGEFTKAVVSTCRQVYPEYNWICVHTAHTKAFDGKEGEDWGRGHGDFDLYIGGVVGYEIYYCRSGIFALHGDGGFQNWAWLGNTSSQSSDGRILMFRRP
ncbi:hypothetical protein NMY22_g13968 [Coprinellus aureogranulatus]|nr:hypothetical protein NMY22_g13968 [Coprinellus aureogranulatus]